jgi:hypothetical protein
MAEAVNLEIIGKAVLETRDALRKLAGLPEAVRRSGNCGTIRPS